MAFLLVFLRVRSNSPARAGEALAPEMAIDITCKDQLNVHHKLSLDKQKSSAQRSKKTANSPTGTRYERAAWRQPGSAIFPAAVTAHAGLRCDLNLTANCPMIKLHGFWRSLASYRVRAALRLKGLEFEEIEVDLLKGAQFTPEFDAVNPQHAVPVLEIDGLHLVQSLPIIEYLEERFPATALLPADAAGRARVRALAQIAASDVHPLIVPRVRNYLGNPLGLSEEAKVAFIQHWFKLGSDALEARLARDTETGSFAHGETPGLADVVLTSHVLGARMFKTDLSAAPRLGALADRCLAQPAFDPGGMKQML